MATNNPILTDYSTLDQINQENDLTEIEVERGIGSYFPIFVSLGITLYGFYLFLQTIVDTQLVIYGTLAFLGVLLVYIEHHRAGLIADFLGSRLEKLVNKLATIPSIGLMVGMAITVLFIALDTWGAMQSADSIERMLVDGIVKHSEQYKIENAKAKSGVNEAKAYQTQLREWRTAKSEHYNGCDASWRVPTYRTKNQQCKDKFTEVKPTAVMSTGGTIELGTYNAMEEKAKADVSGYRKMFFWVFLGFSILLNYFAMATLFNQYRKKRKELTVEIIDELTDRMELMNAEKINKISMSTQAQKQKLEEKNIIDVEIEKETYNIVIAKRAKALVRKREIPLKIMNNEHVMEQQKAGHVVNPFADNTDDDLIEKAETRKSIHYPHDTKSEWDILLGEMRKVNLGGKVDLTEDFKNNNQPMINHLMDEGALVNVGGHYWTNTDNMPNCNPPTLITRLWNNNKVKIGDKLTSKTKIINVQDRSEDKLYKEIMKKLTTKGVVKFKVGHGYYALGGLDEALRAV